MLGGITRMKLLKRFWFLLLPALVALVPWILWLVMQHHRVDSHADPIALFVAVLMMVFCIPGFVLIDAGEFLPTRVAAISCAFDFAIVLFLCLLIRAGRRHDTNAA